MGQFQNCCKKKKMHLPCLCGLYVFQKDTACSLELGMRTIKGKRLSGRESFEGLKGDPPLLSFFYAQ